MNRRSDEGLWPCGEVDGDIRRGPLTRDERSALRLLLVGGEARTQANGPAILAALEDGAEAFWSPWLATSEVYLYTPPRMYLWTSSGSSSIDNWRRTILVGQGVSL